jgi:hypothetical protein
MHRPAPEPLDSTLCRITGRFTAFQGTDQPRILNPSNSVGHLCRITGLQAAIEDTTEVEELRSLQRELEAFKSRERQLLKELGDIRAEKEELRVAREKAGLEARDKVR